MILNKKRIYLAGCENNFKISYELEIAYRMEHGAWGLNCRKNNICANKNIVLIFIINRLLTHSTNCPMLHAPCPMHKIENKIGT